MSRIKLADDGTLDTVLRCSECGEEFRGNYDPGELEAAPGSVTSEEMRTDYDAWVDGFIEEVEAEHICGHSLEDEEEGGGGGMTAERLIELFKERCGDEDPVAAACWWIAYQEAQAVFESLTAKDLARVIVAGEVLGGPFKTEEDIRAWLENGADYYEWGDIEARLGQWYADRSYPNECPYCGGPYTLSQSCTGPRTDNPNENTCPKMAKHRQMVKEALDEEEEYGLP